MLLPQPLTPITTKTSAARLGFQVVEDFTYTIQQSADLSSVVGFLFVRGLLTGIFSHAAYTAVTGAGLGYCIARRDRSNTPLQALTLMNDPMFIEIAEAFGKSISEAPGDDRSKIQLAFRRALTRLPSSAEMDRLAKFHQEHQNWTALARVLLNLDEAITKP